METTSSEVSPGGEREGLSNGPRVRIAETISVASEFVDELSTAESTNLRERLGRLEASIAFWAADLDELNSENERLGAERDELRRRLRAAEDRATVAEDARATLEVALDDRENRIRILETGLLEADRRDIDAHATRSRLHAFRRRVRERMLAQSREIEDLRRMVKLGHAARLQVEREVRLLQDDARRDARYLDRVEQKLRGAKSDRE